MSAKVVVLRGWGLGNSYPQVQCAFGYCCIKSWNTSLICSPASAGSPTRVCICYKCIRCCTIKAQSSNRIADVRISCTSRACIWIASLRPSWLDWSCVAFIVPLLGIELILAIQLIVAYPFEQREQLRIHIVVRRCLRE